MNRGADIQFMYLTVPLPIAQHRKFKAHFVSKDPTQPPIKVNLLISQNASFQQVKERIGTLLKVNPSHVSQDLWTTLTRSSLVLICGKEATTIGFSTRITTRSAKRMMSV